MAKIKKIIENGGIQYLATITDAVKNPNNSKTVTEELSELGSEVMRAKEVGEELENSVNAYRYGYNVTVNGLNGGIHTIETAIKDVPPKFRMLGQKITFRTENGDWATYHNESLSLDNYKDVNDWVKEVGISSVTGDINISNNPDYEDLTEAADGTLKFADKEYSAESFSGLGRVYLRKNIVDGVNVLTQDMISKPNTIYIIQYDYDLQGAEIAIPECCVLDFQGGSLNNGVLSITSGFKLKGNEGTCKAIQIIHNKDVENIVIENCDFDGTKTSNGEATFFFKTQNYKIAHNISIRRCQIHGYNSGIKINGNSVSICENVFYDNGHELYSDRIVQNDIEFQGQYGNEVNYINNMIKGNKCLSRYVDRHIDAGENFFFGNIIIDGNICMACDDNGKEEIPSDGVTRHCIQVGYTGKSEKEKQAIIVNNICKGSSWSGIYVRGYNDGEDFSNVTKYVIILANNIIDNIYRSSINHLVAGIAIECKESSIISHNIISRVGDLISDSPATYGINLGFIFSKGHTFVHGNSIKQCIVGIANDTYAKKVDVCDNRITNCSVGIDVTEGTRAVVSEGVKSELGNIKNNVIQECATGIKTRNTYFGLLNIAENTIIGLNKEGIGIDVMQRSDYQHPLHITNNAISNVNIGVCRRASSFDRNADISNYIDFNKFSDCAVAIEVGVNSALQLFVVEGNLYNNCDAKFNTQSWAKCLYDGVCNSGIYVFYDDESVGDYSNSVYGYITNSPVCFLKKKFKKGDVVISRSGFRFNQAICLNDYPEISDNGSKWSMSAARLKTKEAGICSINGQIIYDTSDDTVKYYKGSSWLPL